jgi:hypothetical protein
MPPTDRRKYPGTRRDRMRGEAANLKMINVEMRRRRRFCMLNCDVPPMLLARADDVIE